ncbi:MAG: ABC transporter permease [Phototrophicales bacterium]|nr:ABC transporter permease [Phototrophicales bacterium]
MIIIENIRVALSALNANKLRSFLTMIGITIGVTSVIVLVSVGQALESFVIAGFENIGSNLVVVFAPLDSPNSKLITLDEVASLSDVFRVPDALYVMAQDNMNRQVVANGVEYLSRIEGVEVLYPTIFNRDVVGGRFFTQNEVDGIARVAILGQKMVDRFFPSIYPIGQTIRIGGVRFTVIGVLSTEGGEGLTTFLGGDADDIILVPLSTAQTRLSGERVLTGERPVDFVAIQARDSESVSASAEQIRQTLREERNISFRDEDNFQIVTQSAILDTLNQITTLLTLFLSLLAGISLVVGGIGIMNIMLVTVTERTREIGLRKATGAKNSDILLQFLTESMTLALIGGAIGIGIAFILAFLVTALVADLEVSIRFSTILLVVAISGGIGMFFGAYPANRASKLNPIEALRYE